MIEVQSRICVSDTLFSQSTFEMIWPLVQQHSNIIYAYLLILIIDGILSAGEEEKKFSHFVEFSKVFKLFSAHSSTQTFESKRLIRTSEFPTLKVQLETSVPHVSTSDRRILCKCQSPRVTLVWFGFGFRSSEFECLDQESCEPHKSGQWIEM